MTNKRDYRSEVVNWLNRLAELTAGTASVADTKTKIVAMTAALIEDDHPIEAFCKESLYEISRRRTFFPTYAELHEGLTTWWQANRPRSYAVLPGPEDHSLTPEDRVRIETWQRNCGEGFANSGANGDLRARMTICLDLIRLHAPRAFRYLTQNDTDAASIAVQRGWLVERRRDHTPEEIAHVQQLAREAVAHLAVPRAHRIKPPTAEPSSIDEVQPFVDKMQAEFQASHGRSMGAMTREQVDAAYTAQPLARRPYSAAAKPTDEKRQQPADSNPPPAELPAKLNEVSGRKTDPIAPTPQSAAAKLRQTPTNPDNPDKVGGREPNEPASTPPPAASEPAAETPPADELWVPPWERAA